MTKAKMIQGLDVFTLAYIECALWSTNDESTPCGGVPLDRNYGAMNLSKDTLETMIQDCKRFQLTHADDLTDYPPDHAGHDFWLTRNGHGCGFWENDFGTPEANTRLTEACKALGEVNLYVSKGVIYQ